MAQALLYMDAVITPNRSLSRRGFRTLMTVLVALNLAMATMFAVIGALPVPVFLGLDVLGLFIAFRLNYRAASQAERVQVSAQEVRVLHQIGDLAKVVWVSPTAFTRVDVEADGEHEAAIHIRLSGKAVSVGHALSPPERSDFAKALQAAIRAARAERHKV